jgi:hypothetical protein
LADSFGGEFRKAIDNEVLQKDINNYSELLSTIRKVFNCVDTAPGSTRVSSLESAVVFV